MSTWTNVTDTVLEPGQPIRSVDIIAIKNNILAVPAGAANAPRVQTAAIQDTAVTTAKLATGERMTTANVLSATAGASAGAVGTYAFAGTENIDSRNAFGTTRAGSTLRTQGVRLRLTTNLAYPAGGNESSLSGTWRCMGTKPSREGVGSAVSFREITLWLRIS